MNADPSYSVPHRSFSEIKRLIREGVKSDSGLVEPLSYDEFIQYMKDAEIEKSKAKDMIEPRMKRKEPEIEDGKDKVIIGPRVMPPWYLAMKKKEAEIEDGKAMDRIMSRFTPLQLEKHLEKEKERAKTVARIKENRKIESEALSKSPEVWAKYRKQIEESEGFDIDIKDFPGTCFAAKIIPIELDKYSISKFHSTEHAKFAIKQHNKSMKELGVEYVFKELLSSNVEVVCGFLYYLTFEAYEIRPGNESAPLVRTFQARVLDEPGPRGNPSIELFRPKQKGTKK